MFSGKMVFNHIYQMQRFMLYITLFKQFFMPVGTRLMYVMVIKQFMS